MSPSLYIAIYYYLILFIVLSVYKDGFHHSKIKSYNDFYTISFISFLLAYITFRHLDQPRYFGDTGAYVRFFEEVQLWGLETFKERKDYGFTLLTYFCTFSESVRFYLFVVGFLYCVPLYLAFKKEYPSNYFFAILLYVCSFSFIGYGVNGLRNGLATTFIIAMMFTKKPSTAIIYGIVAASFHKSALLPFFMYYITKRYNDPKMYIKIWFFMNILVILTHNAMAGLIGSIDIFGGDSRLSDYATGESEVDLTGRFSHTGYRWDFVAYSALPIVLGYYYIFKRNYINFFYQRLLCTYIGCNTFWILFIYRPYNNRFAYLSWFMYTVILAHPLLKNKKLLGINQKMVEQSIILINYLFTFYMYII